MPLATARAVLTGVRRVPRHRRSTGPCGLVRKAVRELTPRRVMNTLGQTPVMHQPVDRPRLHRDQGTLLAHATAVLLGAIASSPGEACRHPSHSLTPLPAFGGIRLRLAQAPLDRGQGVFLGAKAPRILQGISPRERGTGLPSDSTAHRLPRRGQRRWLPTCARTADGPLAGTAALNGGRLRLTVQGTRPVALGTRPVALHQPDVPDPQPLGLTRQCAAHRHRRERETSVASLPAHTRLARLFGSCTHPPKERRDGAVHPDGDVLHDRGLPARQPGPYGAVRGRWALRAGRVACWS